MAQTAEGDQALEVVFVPTNHIYVGDIFLLSRDSGDIIHSNLSVREGIGEVHVWESWCMCVYDGGGACARGG